MRSLFAEVARAYTSADESAQARAEAAIFLLPRLLLVAPPRHADGADAAILPYLRGRLRLFYARGWLALLASARKAWPLGRPRRPGPSADSSIDEERILADRALALAAAGNFSKASQLLTSAGIAPANEHTRTQLERLLCRRPDTVAPSCDWVTNFLGRAAAVDTKILQKTLREAPKAGAADLAGWHYEHLQILLGDLEAFGAFARFAAPLSNGQLSPRAYATMRIGCVTPMRKGLKG